MNREPQKRTEESNPAVAKLELEKIKLNKLINLTKEEESLKSLKEKEAKIRDDLQKILVAGRNDEKLERELKEASQEVWIQQKKVEALRNNRDEKMEAIKLEVMGRRREALQALASNLFPRVESLKEELIQLCRKLYALHDVYDRNIPRRFSQISSKKWIKVRKKVPKLTGGFEIVIGRPITKEGFIEDFIQLHMLSQLTQNGWEALPGQDLEPEPLSMENSNLVKALSTPEIITRIGDLQIDISPFSVWPSEKIAEQEISDLEKEIEG